MVKIFKLLCEEHNNFFQEKILLNIDYHYSKWEINNYNNNNNNSNIGNNKEMKKEMSKLQKLKKIIKNKQTTNTLKGGTILNKSVELRFKKFNK
jgi:hypothetical protein